MKKHANESSRQRLERALYGIGRDEGPRACLTVYAAEARAAADAADRRVAEGRTLGPLDGAIITVKDLFDVAGEVTRAGSALLATEGALAQRDAPAVQRARAAGAVIVAKTNMTEFAFSGVGANPHFGTPGNPADRARIPGGSTSGGGVAVADAICEIAIGTDTGGSTRIPASLCGIVGFKPTQARVPLAGAYPLSFSLDSVGPMARTVHECANADAILTQTSGVPFRPRPLFGLRAGIVQGFPLDDLDADVGRAFSEALRRLAAAGVAMQDFTVAEFEALHAVNARGGIVPPEAFAIHREHMAGNADKIDPNVRTRLAKGESLPAADYIANLRARADAVQSFDAAASSVDFLLMPTTPITAPLQADVASADGFAKLNALLLRNPSWVNFMDACAVSLPMQLGNHVPCGLSLVGRRNHDRDLLAIAASVEPLLT